MDEEQITEEFKKKWRYVEKRLSDDFFPGEIINLDAILFLIGVQEVGKIHEQFSRDDKVNVMHVAVCRLLSFEGYYEFSHTDENGWPHYEGIKQIPELTVREQTLMIKRAIITYFEEKGFFDSL